MTMDIDAHFPNYVNQNVLVWTISLVFLAFIELNKMQNGALYWLSLIVAILMTISVVISMVVYTYNYCKKKIER